MSRPLVRRPVDPVRKTQGKARTRRPGGLPTHATTQPASSSWPKIIPNRRLHWDALGWVLRHVQDGPEVETAVLKIGERHLQDDRLGDLCAVLTRLAPSETGERLLRRVIEASPHRGVREQAYLGLAFYETRLGKLTRRVRSAPPEQKERWIKALGQARYDRLASLDPAILVPTDRPLAAATR